MQAKKQQLEPDMKQDWFKVGKGVHQGCILSLCLFNFYAEYIMENAELDEPQLESRLPGEISITSVMQGEGTGNLHQYSCLGNPIDRVAWCATVHRVTKSQT